MVTMSATAWLAGLLILSAALSAHAACSGPFNQVANAKANVDSAVSEGTTVVWTCNPGYVAQVATIETVVVTATCTNGALSPPVSSCEAASGDACDESTPCPGLSACVSGTCACPAGTVAAYNGAAFVTCLSPQITASDALLTLEAQDVRFTLATEQGATVATSILAMVEDIESNSAKFDGNVPSLIAQGVETANAYADEVYVNATNASAAMVQEVKDQVTLVNGEVIGVQNGLASLANRVKQLESDSVPKTCADVLHSISGGHARRSQVYTLYPDGDTSKPVERYCELHLSGDPSTDVNIALNQPTEQSSTAHDGVSSRGNDGQFFKTVWSQGSCVHGEGGEGNAWWAVDLGKTALVDHVIVAKRTGCCFTRSDNFEIRLAPEAWALDKRPTEYPECTPGVRHIPTERPYTVECDNVVGARFVIFYLPGGSTAINFCELGVFEASADIDDAGGWTLIASTDGNILAEELTTYYTNEAVLPGQNALLEPYFTQDITTMGTELLVMNTVGEKYVFQFADLTSPLIFDSDNTVVAGKSRFEGIVYGNSMPYADKFQIGASCDSSTCNRAAATQPAGQDYSPGMMLVFDWETSGSDASANFYKHAQLGGTAAMGTFAVPLTRMYIR